MGEDNVVGPFCVIVGVVTIGSGNWFGAGVTIGAPPEVRGFPHGPDPLEPGGFGVVIGHDGTFREGAQIHSGWQTQTRIGDSVFVMNQAYIAHDTELASDVTLASGVRLGGHGRIGRGANLGLGTTVHQRVTIGGYAMVGMSSVVTRPIPPFSKAYGSPSRIRGVNNVGMERAGFAPDDVVWAQGARDTDPSPRVRDELVWFEGEP